MKQNKHGIYILQFDRTFFVALFVLSLCPFDIFAGVAAFVIGLSQISSFFFFDVRLQV